MTVFPFLAISVFPFKLCSIFISEEDDKDSNQEKAKFGCLKVNGRFKEITVPGVGLISNTMLPSERHRAFSRVRRGVCLLHQL